MTCNIVKTHIKFWQSLVKSGLVSNVECSTKSGGVRHELNLCVGSPVTEAYGKSDNVLESSRSYVGDGVSGITESWGLKLLCYLLCLQGSDTEEKESQSSVTSSPNDKQIDPALWLWQSKQG